MAGTGPHISSTDRGVLLKVKVVPGSSKTGMAGVLGGALKVAVSAPPEKGKANQALIKLLSKSLNVPRKTIDIVQGATSAHKVVLFNGLSVEQLRAALMKFMDQ